ncbi:MAG: cytochrome c [Candidatus Binatia bacterium]
MVRKTLMAVLFGFITLTVSSQVWAQADVLEKRQKAMKSNSAAAKAIKAATEAKDYATIQTKAKDIMGTAEKIPDLFPKGSTKGKTKAKAEIWDNWDDFTKKSKNLSKAAGELADAAKAKDDAAVTAKIKAVSGACGDCHKAYRAKEYSE